MQQRTLLGQTARVRFDQVQGDPLQGGIDTASCVASGAELVMRGLASQLQELAKQLVQPGVSSTIVLTGGDANHLQRYLSDTDNVVLIPELVMDGLSLAKRERV